MATTKTEKCSLSGVASSAAADAVVRLLDGGTVRIYDGRRPATVDTAITDQTLLAELAFSKPAFEAAVDGVAKARAIAPDQSANGGEAGGRMRRWRRPARTRHRVPADAQHDDHPAWRHRDGLITPIHTAEEREDREVACSRWPSISIRRTTASASTSWPRARTAGTRTRTPIRHRASSPKTPHSCCGSVSRRSARLRRPMSTIGSNAVSTAAPGRTSLPPPVSSRPWPLRRSRTEPTALNG